MNDGETGKEAKVSSRRPPVVTDTGHLLLQRRHIVDAQPPEARSNSLARSVPRVPSSTRKDFSEPGTPTGLQQLLRPRGEIA